MDDEILTAKEAKKYLKIKSSLIYKLLQSGKLPASKVGNVWRIRRSKLNRWLDEQEITRRNR